MPKPVRTRPVSGSQVLAYANKAKECGDAALNELGSERYIAATSLAIHAADAVCFHRTVRGEQAQIT